MRLFKWAALLLLVGACGTAGEPGSETTTTTEETATTVEKPTTTDVPTSLLLPEGFPESMLESIVEDAARSTGADQTDVDVISVEERTFNDASLGCPKPGRMYAQVLTDGFVVLLDVGGEQLDYRVARSDGHFVLCK